VLPEIFDLKSRLENVSGGVSDLSRAEEQEVKTVHRSPFAVYRSPFTVHRLPGAVHRSPFGRRTKTPERRVLPRRGRVDSRVTGVAGSENDCSRDRPRFLLLPGSREFK
jgi:hypothetical protein